MISKERITGSNNRLNVTSGTISKKFYVSFVFLHGTLVAPLSETNTSARIGLRQRSAERSLDSRRRRRLAMLHYAFLFLIVALVAALLGFWGIAGAAADIAKVLFVVFLVLFCVALLFGYAII
jgi:uncharacterized membrane protein YtjA (UPF0391 family)